MVRIKHRYLLIEILYPTAPSGHPKSTNSTKVPDTVLFHAPSPDYMTSGLLAKMIKDVIAELYGDYGFGVAGNSLTGLSLPSLPVFLDWIGEGNRLC